MAKAKKIGLFARKVIENVSVAGFQALLTSATQVSEGQANDDGRYFGSTIVSIDLQELKEQINDACDVATATRLCQCMAEDRDVLAQMGAIGQSEAQKLCSGPLVDAESDVRMRAEGSRILVDIDVEGQVIEERRCAGEGN